MSNSPLVNFTLISPNSNPRNDTKILKITPHHMAGSISVQTCGNIFQSAGNASANYGIDGQGNVGMYVEEHNRAWASDSRDNDFQAVTIEVANDGGAPDWHVSDTALAKLIDLCVDICKRNGIKELDYTGDSSGTLTRHNMFSATACPGPYLQSKFPYIAEEVNKRIGEQPQPQPQPDPDPSTINYFVRKSYEDAKSQIGAFINYDYAKDMVDKNSGYKVFDDQGTAVYAPGCEFPYTAEVTANDGLNYRTQPSTEKNEPLGTYPKGTRIKVVKYEGNWAMTDRYAWVFRDYIKSVT